MPNFFGGYNPQPPFIPYPNAPPQNNSVSVVTVQGEAGARVYPVAAGNTVLLIDFDSKKFWLKSTDTNGMPSRFSSFNFSEDVKTQGDTGQFISRNEFETLKQGIDAQLKQIADMLRGGTSSVPTTSSKSSAVPTEIL